MEDSGLEIIEEDYKEWKIKEEVYVRSFGTGKILNFEINKDYNSYRIQIDLSENPFNFIPYFRPEEIFKLEKEI